MIFRQLLTSQSGCASYIVGCGGQGVTAVVDPQLEVDRYIDIAGRYGMRVTEIIAILESSQERFVDALFAELPTKPAHFQATMAANRGR